MKGLENKLLVVVDMQKDFIDGALGTKEAVDIVDNMQKFIEEWNGHIVFTRDTHDENYMNTIEGKHLPVKHCIKDTDGWNIPSRLTSAACKNSPLFFNKTTFGSTELQRYVSNMNFDEIIICGVCTGICVISNTLLIKAVVPETKISVIEDLCACVTPESHKEAIDIIKLCHIDIINMINKNRG